MAKRSTLGLIVKRFLQACLIVFIISNVINSNSRHVSLSIGKEQVAYWKAVIRDKQEHDELNVGAVGLESLQLMGTHVAKCFGVVNQQVFGVWVPQITTFVRGKISGGSTQFVVDNSDYHGTASSYQGEIPTMCPIHSKYRLTSDFGYRKHPTKHIPKMHYGIDMACMKGTSIMLLRKALSLTRDTKRGMEKPLR